MGQTETTAVATKTTTALAYTGETWGTTEKLDTSDILIPKLLLMQAMSELVSEGKAQMGDLVRSTNKEVLGGKNTALEFIPVTSFKTWILEEKIGQKFEFRGIEEMNATNKEAAMEWEQNGTTWRRNRCLNFYALLPQDIAKEKKAMEKAQTGEYPDPDDALLPVLISFQRTGYGTGKSLITHFAKAQHFGVPPAVNTFRLKSAMEKNDKGTYFVPMIEKSRNTTKEELVACKKWFDVLTKARVKVDNSDLEKPAAVVTEEELY
jgi:hypothetical protein